MGGQTGVISIGNWADGRQCCNQQWGDLSRFRKHPIFA